MHNIYSERHNMQNETTNDVFLATVNIAANCFFNNTQIEFSHNKLSISNVKNFPIFHGKCFIYCEILFIIEKLVQILPLI